MSAEYANGADIIRPPETCDEKRLEIVRIWKTILDTYGDDRSNDEHIRRDIIWSDDNSRERYELMEVASRSVEGETSIRLQCINLDRDDSMSFFSWVHEGKDRFCVLDADGQYIAVDDHPDSSWRTGVYDYLLEVCMTARTSHFLSTLSPEDIQAFDEIVLNTALDNIDALHNDEGELRLMSLFTMWRHSKSDQVRELGLRTTVCLATGGVKNEKMESIIGWRLNPEAVRQGAYDRIYGRE